MQDSPDQRALEQRLAGLSPEKRALLERALAHKLDAAALREQALAELPANWLYTPQWQPRERIAAGPPPPGHVLLLADRGGVAAALADRLRAAGSRCTLVHRGARPGREGDALVLGARRPEDFQTLLAGLGPAPTTVMHLWGLDAPSPLRLGATELQDEALDLCSSALYLTRALLGPRGEHERCPRLWLLTRGAQRDDGPDAAGLLAAPLWGLGTAIADEHPELACVRVDLEPGTTDPDVLAALLAEGSAGQGEDQLAWRGARRHVLRLARMPADPSLTPPLLRADATYLITGGLGGLGLQAARWLVERGARHLVLLGRSRAAEVAARTIRELKARGAVIVSLAGVAIDADLEFLMAEMAARLPPLRGVVHAASEIDDGILHHQTRERLARVFAATVGGAWNLHRWAEGRALEFFVSLTATSERMGASGQSNHLAATAFLGALARHRRSAGLPGQCIEWGAGIPGADDDRELERRLRERGLRRSSAPQAVELLDRVFTAGHAAEIGVMPIEWPVFLRQLLGAPPPLFRDLGGGPSPERRAHALLARVREDSPDAGLAALRTWLCQRVAHVLGFPAGSAPEPAQTLHELGLDSLMGVDLKNLLLAELGVEVPVDRLVTGPAIAALAELLHRALRPDAR